MINSLCRIIENKRLAPSYFRLRFEKGFASFVPGQFCMIRVPSIYPLPRWEGGRGEGGPLLRRPFSLCREDDTSAEIVYKVVGPTTRAMSSLGAGDAIEVLGPLGRKIDWSGYKRVIGVAGGYGISPMLGLGTHLKGTVEKCPSASLPANSQSSRTAQVRSGCSFADALHLDIFDQSLKIGIPQHPLRHDISYEVYYGVRGREDLILMDDFKRMGIAVHVATEDGSEGFKGNVIQLMENEIRETDVGAKDPSPMVWFVCGPWGLLKVAAILARRVGVDCLASVEEYMGCGIGVCLGCVVKGKDGDYIRSCVEGPVMEAKEIKWRM